MINSDKLIVELFIAPSEGTINVNGITGRFNSKHLIDFLICADGGDLEIKKVTDSINEKFGSTDDMFTVLCEMEYVEEERQDEHVLPGYYMIGKVLNVKKEII